MSIQSLKLNKPKIKAVVGSINSQATRSYRDKIVNAHDSLKLGRGKMLASAYSVLAGMQIGSIIGKTSGKLLRVCDRYFHFNYIKGRAFRKNLFILCRGLQLATSLFAVFGKHKIPKGILAGIVGANEGLLFELTKDSPCLSKLDEWQKTISYWIDCLNQYIGVPLSTCFLLGQALFTKSLSAPFGAGIVLQGGYQVGTFVAHFIANYISADLASFLQNNGKKALPWIFGALVIGSLCLGVACLAGSALGASFPGAIYLAAKAYATKQVALTALFSLAMTFGFLKAPTRGVPGDLLSHRLIKPLKPLETKTNLWDYFARYFAWPNDLTPIDSRRLSNLSAVFVELTGQPIFKEYNNWITALDESDLQDPHAEAAQFDADNIDNIHQGPSREKQFLQNQCFQKIRNLSVGETLLLPAIRWDVPLFFLLRRSAADRYTLSFIGKGQEIIYQAPANLHAMPPEEFHEKFSFLFWHITNMANEEKIKDRLSKLRSENTLSVINENDEELKKNDVQNIDQQWICGLGKVSKLLDTSQNKRLSKRATFQAQLLYAFEYYHKEKNHLENSPALCAHLYAYCGALSHELYKLIEEDSEYFLPHAAAINEQLQEIERVVAQAEKRRAESPTYDGKASAPARVQLTHVPYKMNLEERTFIQQQQVYQIGKDKLPSWKISLTRKLEVNNAQDDLADLAISVRDSHSEYALLTLIDGVNTIYSAYVLSAPERDPFQNFSENQRAAVGGHIHELAKKLQETVKEEGRLPYADEVATMLKLVLLMNLVDCGREKIESALLPHALSSVFSDSSTWEKVTFPKDNTSLSVDEENETTEYAQCMRLFYVQPYNGVHNFWLPQTARERGNALFKSGTWDDRDFGKEPTAFEKIVLAFFTFASNHRYKKVFSHKGFGNNSNYADPRGAELVNQPINEQQVKVYAQYRNEPLLGNVKMSLLLPGFG